MSNNDALRNAVADVLCIASNFPEAVQVRLLGQDMQPLIDKTTGAILTKFLAAHDADVRKPLEYRIAEDEKRALRTLEMDREFLQQVADSYGIRTDEVTAAFLARQPKERADVRKAALEEARRIVDGPHSANSGLDSFTLAWVSAALGDAPTPKTKPLEHEKSRFGIYHSGPLGAALKGGQ